MATIRQLLQGTQKVLPKTLSIVPDGKNSPLLSLEIQPFKGVNSLMVISKQKMSGRWDKGTAPAPPPARKEIYTQVMRFVFKESGQVGKDKPKASKNKVLVRCGCSSYYYYYWFWNKKNKAHEGQSLKPYSRKTPSGPNGRPEVNPDHVPGLCKHLVFTIKELKRKRQLK